MSNTKSSIINAIEALRGEGRSLRPLEPDATAGSIDLSTAQMVDPEHPVDPDELMRQFLDDSQIPSARRRIGWWLGLLILMLALAAAWRWTPLSSWLSVDALYADIMHIKTLPAIPFLILGGYIVGCIIALPVTLLIIATLLAFGPWLGLAYAFSGSILGALGGFALGRALGRKTVRQLAGSRLNALSRRLAQRGVLAIIAVRVIPIAPFAVINMVAGASHIRFRDYLIGTSVGMAPGIIAIALFTDRIIASIQSPDLVSLTTLLIVIVAIALTALGVRRWLNSHPVNSHHD